MEDQSSSAGQGNRPVFHFLPPGGSWINDPCAPFYDPRTETFHLFFQYNPKYNDWGEIAWGHATSRVGDRELLDWTMDDDLTLAPGPELYDDKGIFTGGFIPHITEDGQQRTLTLAYTSVNKIPFNYTLPYPIGCESLSLATSIDDGKTWRKHPRNSILPGPPVGDITGWRDPYIAAWEEADQILGHPTGTHMYGVISGGTHRGGPNVFLYRIPRSDLTEWTYLGPLLPSLGRYFNLKNDRWSGDLGINMEVTNFFTFREERTDARGPIERTFLIFGSEGQKPSKGQEGDHLKRYNRGNVKSLWLSGQLHKVGDTDAVQIDIISTGQSDHGLAYALNAFHSPRHGHAISYPWIKEEDLSDELRKEQGWSGCIGIPRKMSMWVTDGVVGCLGGGSERLGGCWEVVHGGEGGGATVITLANEIVPGILDRLKSSSKRSTRLESQRGNSAEVERQTLLEETGNAYVVQTTITFPLDHTGDKHKAGLIIAHNVEHSIYTRLIFDSSTETFTIDRSESLPASHASKGISARAEVVPHTLLRFAPSTPGGEVSQEALELTVIVDKSVVEVFLNRRTAVTTRIYTGYGEGCTGVSTYREGGATFEAVELWDGLACSITTSTSA